MSTRKIYVASSWRNPYQPEVVNQLREEGHEVYDFRNPSEHDNGFAWSSVDKNWENWTTEEYVNALNHPVAQAGFNNDFNAMKWADCCVMVLPCGRSANTEAGWMKGVGKPVFVFSPIKQEPELMYKIYDGIFDSMAQLVSAIDHAGAVRNDYIHDHLINNEEFTKGVVQLLAYKPKLLAFTKGCEELNELATKLLQAVNKEEYMAIEEELVDVQMHIILLQYYFSYEKLKAICKLKVDKMINSDDYKKYSGDNK